MGCVCTEEPPFLKQTAVIHILLQPGIANVSWDFPDSNIYAVECLDVYCELGFFEYISELISSEDTACYHRSKGNN